MWEFQTLTSTHSFGIAQPVGGKQGGLLAFLDPTKTLCIGQQFLFSLAAVMCLGQMQRESGGVYS